MTTRSTVHVVTLVSLFRSYNQFYGAECITVSGFFSICKEGVGDSIWDRARCLSPDFWQKSVVIWVSGNEKMLTGRWQPVGPDEGERGGEKWPLDKDHQRQVCLVQGHIWCVLFMVQRALVRLNRPGIISPGIRAPWRGACTASCSSTSPTTLVSTCLGTSTCHRGGGQGRRCPSNVNSILQFTGARRTQTFRSISKVPKPCFHRSTEKNSLTSCIRTDRGWSRGLYLIVSILIVSIS